MYWFQSNFDRLVSRAGATRLRDELSFEEREGMFRKETKSAKGTGLFVAYPLRSYQMDGCRGSPALCASVRAMPSFLSNGRRRAGTVLRLSAAFSSRPDVKRHVVERSVVFWPFAVRSVPPVRRARRIRRHGVGPGTMDLGGTCVKAHGELELSTRASGRPGGKAPHRLSTCLFLRGKQAYFFF